MGLIAIRDGANTIFAVNAVTVRRRDKADLCREHHEISLEQ